MTDQIRALRRLYNLALEAKFAKQEILEGTNYKAEFLDEQHSLEYLKLVAEVAALRAECIYWDSRINQIVSLEPYRNLQDELCDFRTERIESEIQILQYNRRYVG